MTPQPNDPIVVEVRFVPETGSKRPYEVWLRSARGWYQRGSFATEHAASAKAAEFAAMFKLSLEVVT